MTIPGFKSWHYTACPNCLDVAHLIGPVQTVVGHLHAPIPEPRLPERIHVRVWDEATKAVLPADIDELHLKTQDALQPLDWPLAALVQRWQDDGRPMPVIHVDGDIPWSENTSRLLADAGVRVTTQPARA